MFLNIHSAICYANGQRERQQEKNETKLSFWCNDEAQKIPIARLLRLHCRLAQRANHKLSSADNIT